MRGRDGALLGPREKDRLLAAAGRSATPYRDRALLQVFLAFGPSVRDVLALEVGHVNFPAARLRWPRGGDGAREVSLPPDLLADLVKYVALERNPRSPALFTTRLGHPLGRQQVDRLFRRLARESGIAVTPGLLRRESFVRKLEEQPAAAVLAFFLDRRRRPRAAIPPGV
ncbi:MAG: tyrosine-type recombinase/integrase [Clostridia bacterium]|nr:tyrosine-type recombinase/integrase [Clostridia bacterium]